MTPKMKGHKHDREAADRKERIQELMAKMPAMLDEYRVSSAALLYALVLVTRSQANLAVIELLGHHTACSQETARGHGVHARPSVDKARGRTDAEGAPILHWEE
eukprot:SM000003S10999  [mRNA]  locus=s3:258413:258833:- [translate_table: standard]